ncbi:acyl carrier protein [Streptosporangium sp. NBC_01639]|uniref:acyl carrier protein n=1 Tax=unclassified Streptosporangium TaxID=2632669 RepID=UPI002DD919C1|nr:acyl carrier protein [Streptosporangium sp. NBC_01756]WSC86627.1 acyl carrier protein [Streptosporangium sp. NBC_01756]WTD54924.1 acyl carrier protein [Streptosporangium sp. NBC_01639]
MHESEVADVLRKYLTERILDASNVEIEPDTPLLEWGILNSLTTTRLVGFVREQYGIEIPVEEMVGENFKNLLNISRLVVRLSGE